MRKSTFWWAITAAFATVFLAVGNVEVSAVYTAASMVILALRGSDA